MNRRMDRVNVLLRQEISRVMATELRDPRLSTVVSVTYVDASPDLRHAKVYISVLGDENQKKNTLIALKSASGFIHRAMREGIGMKSLPFLYFYLDNSIERGAEILDMIHQVAPVSEPEDIP